MTAERWWDLLLAAVGFCGTAAAVYLAARLALSSEREKDLRERQQEAIAECAEMCFAVDDLIGQAFQRYAEEPTDFARTAVLISEASGKVARFVQVHGRSLRDETLAGEVKELRAILSMTLTRIRFGGVPADAALSQLGLVSSSLIGLNVRLSAWGESAPDGPNISRLSFDQWQSAVEAHEPA